MRSLVGIISAFLTLFICYSLAWANDISDAEQCQAFPASIQSWSPDSTLTVGGDTHITGTDNGSGRVAFGSIINNRPYKKFCDGQVCQPDLSLLIKEPKIIIDNFGTGNINVASSDVYKLPEGSYNELSISGQAKVIFTGSNYEIKKFELTGSGSAVFLNKTFLKVDTISLKGGGTLDILNNSAGNLTIWSENTSKDKASVYLHFAKVNAAIFSRGKVEVSEYTSVTGSITAHDVILSGSASSTYSGDVCTIDPNANYSLDVTPSNQFALLCQAPKVTYTVYNEDGTVATDYKGTITATYPTGLTPVDPDDNNVYTPLNGVVTVPVKSDTLAEYTIKAELTDFPKKNDSGLLNFVPFAFGIEEQKVIANKPKFVTVTALACNNNNKEVVIDYSGKPTVTSNLSEPIGGVGELDFAPTLSKGLSTSDLSFSDSGKLTVKLEDDNFDCTGLKDCPIGDDGEADGKLQGSFDVYSRPWTFAICDVNNKPLPSGDSDGGAPFISAGTPFSLHVKPIVWQSGGSLTYPVDVSGYCDADITQNFFVTDAPTATVQVNSELDTPKGGRLNGGLIFNNDIDKSGAERKHDAGVGSGAKQYYDYDDVRWREVGSITATADTLGNYLGMDINQGYSNIGRFYPHHLEIESNQWGYEDKDHGHVGYFGFAYMNQPFLMEYTVVAMSKDGSETQNYGFFDSSLQDELALTAINNDNSQSLLNRLFYTNQSTNGWSGLLTNGKTTERNAQYVVNYDDFKFSKKLGSNPNNSEYTSMPDGPYNLTNAKFGVAVIKKVDDVDFDFTSVDSGDKITLDADGDGTVDIGLKFTLQPDFRYGRMALDSVSGPIGGPISVPLRSEYWDGSSFITNPDDSGSQFIPSVYYVMSNLQDSSAKFSDVGTSKVTNGKSSVLKAEQANSQRETVRLFLRQGNDSTGYENSPKPADDPDLKETIKGWNEPVEDIGQPWLQFNWRNLGDEDPSTVVIFGAYRGNDRIIYRGEPNLTAN